MKVLAIDTATDVCGIGLLLEGDRWFECASKAGLNHASFLSEGVHRILTDAGIAPSDLDLIVCSRGPGSFTGLRIGMATAKGLGAGAGVPLVSVPTLDAMAFGLEWAGAAVVPVVDAKKNRVFAAAYRGGKRISGPVDIDLNKIGPFLEKLGTVVLTGPGAELAAGQIHPLEIPVDRRNLSWNRAYTELGMREFHRRGADAPDAGPEYLRKSDAEIKLDGGSRGVTA